MKLKNFRPSRPVTSYAAIQKLVGNCIRSSRWQLQSSRVRSLRYLDLGCGLNTHANFINLDYNWNPKVDLCWDITRGVPFPDRSLRGIFTEHCLEHFPLSVTETIIREARRVLMPGGCIRIVVPDAEIYLTRYTDRLRHLSDISLPFEQESAHDGIVEPILAVNRIFYQDRDKLSGHRFMYDFNFLSGLLLQCGFSKAIRASFMQGGDYNLLIDTQSRAIESLYVEGIIV
jgi:SAM-dependent methyltransferase